MPSSRTSPRSGSASRPASAASASAPERIAHDGHGAAAGDGEVQAVQRTADRDPAELQAAGARRGVGGAVAPRGPRQDLRGAAGAGAGAAEAEQLGEDRPEPGGEPRVLDGRDQLARREAARRELGAGDPDGRDLEEQQRQQAARRDAALHPPHRLALRAQAGEGRRMRAASRSAVPAAAIVRVPARASARRPAIVPWTVR
ncbi:hypothetical protein ACFQY7_20835 [Actinomadura luteofluorescens]|uniref:hypothetical protein n=1 Tax=Actinomadura luteofluorescens TaxID=46163 RepID=UPI0036346D83